MPGWIVASAVRPEGPAAGGGAAFCGDGGGGAASPPAVRRAISREEFSRAQRSTCAAMLSAAKRQLISLWASSAWVKSPAIRVAWRLRTVLSFAVVVLV